MYNALSSVDSVDNRLLCFFLLAPKVSFPFCVVVFFFVSTVKADVRDHGLGGVCDHGQGGRWRPWSRESFATMVQGVVCDHGLG